MQFEGKNPFSMTISPNPTTSNIVKINFNMPYATTIDYFISSIDGKIIDGEIEDAAVGNNTMDFELDNPSDKIVIVTFIFDNKFYVSQKVVIR
jgi:hypothetical protein